MSKGREYVNYSVRIDGEVKRRSEAIYAELGMTLSAAINAFLRKSVREGGFPFDMRLGGETYDAVISAADDAPPARASVVREVDSDFGVVA